MATPEHPVDHAFELVGVTRGTVTPSKELLAEAKALEWSDWLMYPEQKTLSFGIKRRASITNDGDNLCKHANAIRRYINARTEVYILDFIPNHEQTGGTKTVIEVGETCLINEIRMALNGVMARQVRGNIYELHAVNNTPGRMDIMTRHITLKETTGDASEVWHDNFPPTIKLGRLEPASELHITMIFMRPGRVFTNEQPTFDNGEIVAPPDNTCFMHNGFVQWRMPDMIDVKTSVQLRDPCTESPGLIEMAFHPQPYIDPMDTLTRAMQQLVDDFKEIAGHVTNARATLADGKEYAFGEVAVKQVGRDLMVTMSGFDISIGKVIASNAGYLDPTASHFTAHCVHPTKKDVIVRISSADPAELLARVVGLAIERTADLLRQLAAVG